MLRICLGRQYKGMSLSEFAGLFNVEELTIKRDMADLRAAG